MGRFDRPGAKITHSFRNGSKRWLILKKRFD
jgi:hypothetical protein